MIPTHLGNEDQLEQLPPIILTVINQIDCYAVENEKHARRFLKRMGIEKAIQDLEIERFDKRADITIAQNMIRTAKSGKHIAMISEAGCPGIADPGNLLVQEAHKSGIRVIPLTGPSSIFLALMASGMNGQQFCFHGYLPKERRDRMACIRDMERKVAKTGETQLFMDTPYRNNNVLEDLLTTCSPDTQLCIAADITLENEFIKSKPIQMWKKTKIDLHKRPTIFAIGQF